MHFCRPPTAAHARESKMMSRNLLLLQSIQGHLELLAQKHPKKAASPVARKAKQYVQSCLRQAHRPMAA